MIRMQSDDKLDKGGGLAWLAYPRHACMPTLAMLACPPLPCLHAHPCHACMPTLAMLACPPSPCLHAHPRDLASSIAGESASVPQLLDVRAHLYRRIDVLCAPQNSALPLSHTHTHTHTRTHSDTCTHACVHGSVLQDSVSWTIGFAVPGCAMALAILLFWAGRY